MGKREEFDGNLLFSHSSISLDRAYEACTSTGRGIAVEEEASLQPSLSAEEQLKQVLRRSAFSSEVSFAQSDVRKRPPTRVESSLTQREAFVQRETSWFCEILVTPERRKGSFRVDPCAVLLVRA